MIEIFLSVGFFLLCLAANMRFNAHLKLIKANHEFYKLKAEALEAAMIAMQDQSDNNWTIQVQYNEHFQRQFEVVTH